MDDSLIELAQGKFGRVVAFRLKPGADLYLGMEEACRKYGISNGVIVSALGSVNGALFCDADVLPGPRALSAMTPKAILTFTSTSISATKTEQYTEDTSLKGPKCLLPLTA